MEETFFRDPRLPFVEGRYSTGSGRHFKPHLHRTLSIGVIDKGEVEYYVAGERARLATGDLALINPETMHSCNVIKGGVRSYYMLHLETDWCLEIQKSIWRVEDFVAMSKVHLKNESLYLDYIQLMQILMDKTEDLLLKEQILASFYSALLPFVCKQQAVQDQPPENIEKLKTYLRADLKEELTLHALAEKMDINPYTLLRQFKAETGVTPHAYRTNCRVELARELLRRGMDIAETALECGFFDQSHLHRHFKAITTVTPKEYRVNFVQ